MQMIEENMKFNLDNKFSKIDWHDSKNELEPKCGADQWRTRDRQEIMYMHEMSDSHLRHCIRWASTKPQHASRLAGLLAEREARKTNVR